MLGWTIALALLAAATPSAGLNTTFAPGLNSTSSLAWKDCAFKAKVADPTAFDCATLDVPVCYADTAPCSIGNTQTHPLTVMRRVASNKTDAPTLWVLSETDDDAKTADVMERLAQQQAGSIINVYTMHTRLATPPIDQSQLALGVRSPCVVFLTLFDAGVDVNSKMIDAAAGCSRWLERTFGTNATNAYSLDSAVRDVATGLELVQAQELQTNPNVYLLATGKTSWIVQRLLANRASNLTLTGVIFDTPHMMKLPLNRDEIAGNGTSWYLDGCDLDLQCSNKFANLSMSITDTLRKIERLADASAEPSSRCVGSLKNAAYNADRDLKPSHGLRRFLAELRQHPEGLKYVPPLLYRVYRCNENDEYPVETILKRSKAIRTTWTPLTGMAAFAQRVISFSEFWPTPVPSRDALVPFFEMPLVGDGAMVAQLPAYCLLTTSDVPACTALYNQTPNGNVSLVYVPSKSTTATSVNTSVLILTNRLSPVGSAVAARDLYDAFAGQSAVLIESDNIADSELDGYGVETVLQMVGRFVTKQTKQLSGKWRLEDLKLSTNWSTTAPSASTYAAPGKVSVDLTLTQTELQTSFPTANSDAYDYINISTKLKRTTPSDDDGTPYGYYLLLLGGLVLVGVFMVCAGCKRHRKEEQYAPAVHVNVLVSHPAQEAHPVGVPLAVLSHRHTRSRSRQRRRRLSW